MIFSRMMVSPDSEGGEGVIVGIEKHEVEESEKDNMATSFEGGNNEDGLARADNNAKPKELTVNSETNCAPDGYLIKRVFVEDLITVLI